MAGDEPIAALRAALNAWSEVVAGARVDYARDKRLWVYGENPPSVRPHRALRSPGWWALRVAPWGAVAAAAASAAAWFLG
ncbi:MAG: hypothetical protein HYY06_20455 [Deltaproteobacteria bacterium]|nr:hypothetical protein [Deltaproteobacteria bacterium]